MQKSVAVNYNKAVNAYHTLILGIEGVIASTLTSDYLLYSKARADALRTISKMIADYMNDVIVGMTASITEEVARDITGQLNTLVSSNNVLYAHQKNVDTATNLQAAVKNVLLNIYKTADQLIKRGSLERLSGTAISSIDTKVETTVKDKIGRQYSASGYFETMIRKSAVDAYLNAYTAISSALGYDTVIATYADATHRNNGLKLSIKGFSGLPSLDSKRKEVFHPNTQAEIGIVI